MMTNANPARPAKFNFDTVFGASKGAATQAGTRHRSAYTAEEVEAIRQEMFAKGKAAASQEAMNVQAAALISIAQGLGTLISQFDATLEATRNDSAQLALAVGRKLAEAAIDAFPGLEVENLLGECMHKLHQEPRLVVRVNPSLVDAIRERVGPLGEKHGFSGRVVILGEPALSGSSCRIEWADGGIERDLSGTFAGLEEQVARWSASNPGEEN
jgi:flagellar assembly protein FliH